MADSAPDPRSLADVLEETARAAGALLLERFGRVSIEKKGAIDLVTDADRASEALVLERLGKAFPRAAIVAEESGGASGAGLTFIVDPLDGTTNYASNIPHFSVSLGAVDASGPLAGVVFDPVRDELYRAARGGGATCNGVPLRVNRGTVLDDAVLATGLPYDVRTREDDVLGLFTRFVLASRAVRRFGSAALDLAWVAQGRYDGYWERGLKPWDMAAGVLLVSEAGGTLCDYAGQPFEMSRSECVAGDGPLVREMVALTSTI